MKDTLRFAWRRIIHNRLHTAVIVLSLALGIGANTAIFSIVNTLLLGPLPIQDVNRVMFTVDLRTEDDPFETALLDVIALKAEGHSFSGFGLAHYEEFRLLGLERPERLPGASISADYLPTLGIKPLLGRTFLPEDDQPGAAPVALISESMWRQKFGSEQSVIGQKLHLNDRSYSIIGVLPKGFDLPLGTSVWVPLAMNIETLPLDRRSAHNYFLVARLRPGVSVEQANREVKIIAKRLEQTYPERRKNWTMKMIPLRQQLMGDITGQIKPTLFLLLGVVGFLLLITCANVASLLLARSAQRGHETAIQLAMGAGQRRLLIQMLTESLLLSVLGGVAGLLIAKPIVSSLMALKPVYFFAFKDVFQHIGIDSHVLLFSIFITLLTAALFGFAPLVQIGFVGSLISFLKQGGQRTGTGVSGRRLFDMLLISEISIATILLIGAGLTVRSLQKLSDAKLGFRPDHLLALEMYLPASDYPGKAQRITFIKRVLESVRTLPGVVSTGATTVLPLAMSSWDASYTIEGKPALDTTEIPITSDRIVTPGYLETLGVSLLKGRFITEDDTETSAPVVVISKEFARREWPGEYPLGKRVKIGHPPVPDAQWFKVIGVIDDVKEDRYNFRTTRPVWYTSAIQRASTLPMTLLVRTTGNPALLAGAVRRAIWSVNSNQTVANVVTMESQVTDFLGPQRFTAQLSGFFAILGLILAVVGIYGVNSYSVTQRTREFGIRMAVGGQWTDLARMIVARAFRLAILGLFIGSLGGFLLGRVLTSALYQVNPAAPMTFGPPIIVLLCAAVIASYLPAVRLSRFDPIKSLRDE